MRLPLSFSAASLLILSLAGVAHIYSQHKLRGQVMQTEAQETSLPRRVLWVWERAEDLHEVAPAAAGVAVLEETLRLGASTMPIMRHQPILLPEHVSRIAVVRIETDKSFAVHKRQGALLQSAVANIGLISREPGIAALQIDFDAKKSERAFYRRLLTQLREQMPPKLPLDITALVSWCSTDDWISDLPINAAIPMFFRMEPDRRRLLLNAAPEYQVHEPLCSSSAGISTTEPWPRNAAGKRVFLFADHGWAGDAAVLQSLALTHSPTKPRHP